MRARIEQRLPFWEPLFVVLLAIVIDITLPDKLSPLHPQWLLPALEGALLVGLLTSSMSSPHPRVHHSMLRRRLAIALTAVVSAVNLVSLGLLVHFLLQPVHRTPISGHSLILAGSALWITNVLLFGLWYWEIDRGGPVSRRLTEDRAPDFLFPQMTDPKWAPTDWAPQLVDYLYVSLTNATAFSPTDTMPLTATAKWLMGSQAVSSLVTVGLVVARAVNILS
ncbi:MAG TPA: hypothetical protein VKT31_09870 [Solirubrobacteraceae bacterium]|nr:hypothetical protein [Solirubrobacteraceae bacterium]